MPGPGNDRLERRISELGRNKDMPALTQLSAKIRDLKEKKTKLNVGEIEALLDLYAQSGKELRDKIKRLREQDKDTVGLETYKKLMKNLSKDYTALFRYRSRLKKNGNDTPVGIEEFYEKCRTRTISLNGQSLAEQKKVSAHQNVRYKVMLPLEDEPGADLKKGDRVMAYFTENHDYLKLGNKLKAKDVLLQNEREVAGRIGKKYPYLSVLIKPGENTHSSLYDFS